MLKFRVPIGSCVSTLAKPHPTRVIHCICRGEHFLTASSYIELAFELGHTGIPWVPQEKEGTNRPVKRQRLSSKPEYLLQAQLTLWRQYDSQGLLHPCKQKNWVIYQLILHSHQTSSFTYRLLSKPTSGINRSIVGWPMSKGLPIELHPFVPSALYYLLCSERVL